MTNYRYKYLADFEESKIRVKVKQFIKRNAKGKLIRVRAYQRNQTKKLKHELRKPETQQGLAIGTGAIAGIAIASTLGLSHTSFKLLKTRYVSNFKASALWVTKQLKKNPELATPIKASTKKVHFAVAGLSATYKEETESKLFAKLLNDKLGNSTTQIIPIDTTVGNVQHLNRHYKDKLEQVYHAVTTIAVDKLNKGYNPVARNTALEVMKVIKQHPDKDIILHGFSYGTMTNSETIQILRELGVDTAKKVKVINYGGSHFGLAPLTGNNNLSFASHKDPYVPKQFAFPNTVWTKEEHDHYIHEYLNDKSIIAKVNEFIK